ncbi:unnamed protein product [Clonostachys rosea]|uniref:Uncharacterized protein n=1 Tax=Bionectria ochroleuca TaxID=29856 RepID=A0ABY6U1C3_BIOOC|nr:unnamed protein product [Clonostachys rosea]
MSSEPQDPSQAESAVWDKQTRRKFEKQVAIRAASPAPSLTSKPVNPPANSTIPAKKPRNEVTNIGRTFLKDRTEANRDD